MKNKILIPVFFALAVLFGLLIGMFLNYPTRQFALKDDHTQREEKLREIINYIDFEYVDEVNTDSLLDLTITDLLRRLDPHSTYIPREDVVASDESMKGSFDGIGIEFKIYKDTLTVVRVIEGGPSSKGGLKAGNRILTADGVALYGENIDSKTIVESLKGAAGSKVKLKILDKVSDNVIERTIERGKVPLKSVSAVFMPDEETGYIKLDRFAETTSDEVEKALKTLLRKGTSRIILDLRDNPGGLLSAAKSVADQFISDGKLIVFTKDRNDVKNEVYASKKGVFEEGRLVILINEGSASASEIVAGAVQDNDRGIIVGRKSFGKGLVQEEIELEDGSRVRLTTQHYYTPTGRSIQKPYGDYSSGFLNSHGYDKELPPQDSLSVSPLEFTTPGGKKVYGGGGILPDVIVPYDTSAQSTILYHLQALANLDDKAFTYVDKHREELSKYSRKEFLQNYEVDEIVLNDFFIQSHDVTRTLDDEVLGMVKKRIKSFIAYNLYGQDAFLEVYFFQDPITKKALEILEQES